MFGLYLFCAIVGGAFVVFFVVFGGDADTDFGDMDVDADVDLDADVDADSHSALSSLASDYLSVRAAVFFVAFFGLTGVVLDVLDTNADGLITTDEAKADADVSEAFGDLDANGDGFLTLAEYAAIESGEGS